MQPQWEAAIADLGKPRSAVEVARATKGILERIDPGGEGPCPGVPTSPTRACSSFVKYVDMAPTLQRYHAAIVFGPYVLSAKDLQCIKQWPYC